MVRMVFLGSMTKTERIVKAMPLESTLVASWWSILHLVSFAGHEPESISEFSAIGNDGGWTHMS